MIRRLDVKIVFTLIVTVLIPLGFSVYLVAKATDTSLGLGLNTELAEQFESTLEIRRRHIEDIKDGMRLRFAAIADSHRLATVTKTRNDPDIRLALREIIERDPMLFSIRLTSADGRVVEANDDSDPGEKRTLSLEREISLGRFKKLEAVYGVDASLLTAYEKAGKDFSTYRALVDAPPDYLGDRFVWVYLVILGVTVLLSVLIGVLWARRLVGRITKLSKATAMVAKDDLSVRVDPESEDEVGMLIEAFNRMVSELGANRSRIEYLQKISAWQEMARRLAHEIKNPLTPIQLASQQLQEKYQGSDQSFKRLLDQSTEIIKEEVATLRRLTSDFSSFAKLPEIRPEKTALAEFLGECEASLSPVTKQEGVVITFSTPTEPIQVMLDRIMMKRVVDNLVRNAAQALKESKTEVPRISVSALRKKGRTRSQVELRFEDNGPGIAAEYHATIFDPYFTTKSEGTGLGLAISKKIVLEHGGRIWLDETSTPGATFIIVLPI
jgi:nitrogen fixation/metabolism regulation signal transduction histidine kinase